MPVSSRVRFSRTMLAAADTIMAGAASNWKSIGAKLPLKRWIHLAGTFDGTAMRLYMDGKLVGVFSPFDLLFSQTGCKAYGNLGYEPDDARAVATNILLLATCERAKRTP